MSDNHLWCYVALAGRGLMSAAPVMVPSPWFPELVARCAGRDDLDLGVHLTLTSESDCYRWAPISTSDPASGLIDDEGTSTAPTADPWGPRREGRSTVRSSPRRPDPDR